MKKGQTHIPQISFRPIDKGLEMGFEIIDLQELIRRKKHPKHNPFAYHRIDFYAILVLTKGEVVHRVDFKECPISADELILISREQVHAFDKTSLYEGYLIIFTEHFLHTHLSASALTYVYRLFNYFPHTNKYRLPTQAHHLHQLVQAFKDEPSFRQPQVIGASLTIFLFNFQQNTNFLTRPDLNPQHQSYFNKFWELLLLHFQKNRNANFYADKLEISYKHLNDVCKAITGRTAKAFIDAHIALEAKRRLTTQNQSVKEISYALGFDEPTNFVKYFKKLTGSSPLDFRRQLKPG